MLTSKHNYIFSLFIALAPLAISAEEVTTTEVENEQEELAKLSEAFGHFIGRNLKNPGINFDLELVIKGMRNGASGQPAPLPDEEYEQLMTRYQTKAYTEVAEQNLSAANNFMVENGKKGAVVEVEPGKLQYTILEAGDGETVTASGNPMIQYTGSFIDGTVFGSSEQAGGPITIPLAQTIPGFSKGLVGMLEGEKRRLFVHPDLGYGTSGQLPPNSLLIFDIEIVKANAAEEPAGDEGDEAEEPLSE